MLREIMTTGFINPYLKGMSNKKVYNKYRASSALHKKHFIPGDLNDSNEMEDYQSKNLFAKQIYGNLKPDNSMNQNILSTTVGSGTGKNIDKNIKFGSSYNHNDSFNNEPIGVLEELTGKVNAKTPCIDKNYTFGQQALSNAGNVGFLSNKSSNRGEFNLSKVTNPSRPKSGTKSGSKSPYTNIASIINKDSSLSQLKATGHFMNVQDATKNSSEMSPSNNPQIISGGNNLIMNDIDNVLKHSKSTERLRLMSKEDRLNLLEQYIKIIKERESKCSDNEIQKLLTQKYVLQNNINILKNNINQNKEKLNVC